MWIGFEPSLEARSNCGDTYRKRQNTTMSENIKEETVLRCKAENKPVTQMKICMAGWGEDGKNIK